MADAAGLSLDAHLSHTRVRNLALDDLEIPSRPNEGCSTGAASLGHLENEFQFDRDAKRKTGNPIHQATGIPVFFEDVL